MMILLLLPDWSWEKQRITYRFSVHQNPQLELFDEIWKEGMKPEEWLDTYLEQANLI